MFPCPRAPRTSPHESLHDLLSRVTRLAASLIVVVGLLAATPGSLLAESVERPNIVFILADDQGWADIGYHGSDVKTPNLDRLAAEGARLDQHYVYPTCSPTRVALLTGRFPSRFGVVAPLASTTKVTPEDMHLPQQLRRLGYRTHISGKWHIGEEPQHRPLRHGFDTSYGYLRGQIDPYTHRYKFGDHVTWHRNDEFIEEDGHVTRLITDEAIRIIDESDKTPFFLYVAHHAPHFPLNEPPKWIEPYKETIDDVWRRHYAASLTHMDHHIGRIIEALERAGKRQSTLVIYSSDNGGQRQWSAPEREYNGRYAPHTTLGNNAPLRGWKGELYEGGIRVPTLVNWPGVIEAEGIVETPLHVVDWAPTLIKLAGGELSPDWQLEGEDVWPVLTGTAADAEPRTFYWRTPSQSAVRQGDWKLVVGRQETTELFDLSRDPYEEEDLASAEPRRVAELRALLDALAEEDD
jgi:arylsulfatase A-like enzyme